MVARWWQEEARKWTASGKDRGGRKWRGGNGQVVGKVAFLWPRGGHEVAKRWPRGGQEARKWP